MSRKQGRRRTDARGAGGKKPPAREAVRRLGLMVFGAMFLVLFLVVAIAEGIGDPSVPAGDVAVVEEAPEGLGEISEAEFRHALDQAAAQAQVKGTPEPGDPQYEELKETALNAIFEAVWLQGLAAELDITVTDKQLEDELAKLKEESFKSEAEFKKFLKESKYTQADVDERVKLQKLAADIQTQLGEEVPAPSESEIEAYYEAAKGAQFTEQPSRDVRLIINKDRAKAEQALAALEKDNTAKSWRIVARKYSEDPATKETGGLQQGLQEGAIEEPLSAAIFEAPEGQIEGPIDAARGFTVFEVFSTNPESVQELKDVAEQIQTTLAQRTEQEFFAAYVANFNATWTSRTFCAEGFETSRCANFKGDGHPPTAPPACYEADPEGERPEACPAPVFQLVPALPGSVNPLQPQGQPLTQRPRPVGEGATSEEAPPGLPGGTPPPPGVPSE